MNDGLGAEGGGGGGMPRGFGAGMTGGAPPAAGVGEPPRRGPGTARSGATLDPLVGPDDPSKPLRSKLLAVPALRARYLGYVRDVANRWLDWKTLAPTVGSYQALIEQEVARDTRKLYPTERFRSGIEGSDESLKSFIEQQRAYLLKQ